MDVWQWQLVINNCSKQAGFQLSKNTFKALVLTFSPQPTFLANAVGVYVIPASSEEHFNDVQHFAQWVSNPQQQLGEGETREHSGRQKQGG